VFTRNVDAAVPSSGKVKIIVEQFNFEDAISIEASVNLL